MAAQREMASSRETYGHTLLSMAEEYPDIVVLGGDLNVSVFIHLSGPGEFLVLTWTQLVVCARHVDDRMRQPRERARLRMVLAPEVLTYFTSINSTGLLAM